MKVQELVENIQHEGFNLADALQVKKYLPIDVKRAISQGIIYECVGAEFGTTKIDSVQKYMSYVRYMITTHTDLEYTDADYDIVCSTEYGSDTLLNAIFDCFKRDADECKTILDLMVDDYMHDLSVESMVANFVNEFGATVKGFADKISGLDIENLIPKGLDVEKLNGFLNKYMK